MCSNMLTCCMFLSESRPYQGEVLVTADGLTLAMRTWFLRQNSKCCCSHNVILVLDFVTLTPLLLPLLGRLLRSEHSVYIRIALPHAEDKLLQRGAVNFHGCQIGRELCKERVVVLWRPQGPQTALTWMGLGGHLLVSTFKFRRLQTSVLVQRSNSNNTTPFSASESLFQG